MKVTGLEEHGGSVRVWAKSKLHTFNRLMLRRDDIYVWRDSVGVCRAPVCELHVRDLGGGKHVCVGHWSAWSQAA